MDLKVVLGLEDREVKAMYKDFYEELKKIDIPQVTIKYEEIKFYYMDYEEISIIDFNAEPKHCGYGTKAMLEILKIADKYKIVISLTPNTDLFDSKVSKFWRKLGFSKDPKDLDNRIYLRYYEGYERKNQNEASNKKENDEKTFLEKIKTFFK
ncbi:hypothetical protein [Fusobacterium nucleatum]|uniref:hypothetical protein n=1 Tax=Fusobacterium nucleatum TaxID=851 RepID=UPI0004129461|nr:hypothetical protein [Fusobacterium nucleatum]ALF24762.1 hypothetical protein RO05_10440 [Fusobacterium nucleatum subsp. nucleatum ChDC F316]ASG25998.1 hypothetical protein RN84_03435 [Fusobacterium nucleatum subsp. nucleatum]